MKKTTEFSTEKFLGIKYEEREDGGYIYASVPVIVRLTEGELIGLPEIRKDEGEEREFFMDILRRGARNVPIDNMAVFDATDIVYGDQDTETICSTARMVNYPSPKGNGLVTAQSCKRLAPPTFKPQQAQARSGVTSQGG